MGKKGRYWALRRRKPLPELITVDENKKPLKAALFVSYDYAGGSSPGIFKGGTGYHWEQVTSGNWRLLEDRIGVYLTMDDPNSWVAYKKNSSTDASFPAKVSMVDQFADSTKTYPTFMLVCCVDMDDDFNVTAPRRMSSTTSFTVTRRVDARDRFRKTMISRWSWYADDTDFGVNDVTVEDDTADAQALADGQRRHGENAICAGTVTIPRLTTAYLIGDKITAINGRGVSLRSNLGANTSESPVYPSVVGLTLDFEDAQQTILTLSDVRAEPPPKRQARHDEP
jgi:hypothetical protein